MDNSARATFNSPAQRRQRILQELAMHGEVSVEKLAESFAVSGMTVRRDLQDLADSGQVVRTHGGAALASRVSFEFRFLERARKSTMQKLAIARAAAELVQDEQTVMLDSGTTTLAIARELQTRRKLTVITSSLPIASELFGCESIRLVLLGGFLQHDTPDLVGPITESNIQALHADVAFLGADGVDEQAEVYNASPILASMLEKMAAACDEVYAVADHTKIGKRALIRFGNVAKWQGLITDCNVDAEIQRKLERAGVTIIQASEQERIIQS